MAEIKELRQELKDLIAVVQRLAYEIHRASENEAHEREKLVLRLENELLKFERRLPSGKSDKEKDLGEEMADVLWVLICLANQTGVDLTEALNKNFEKKNHQTHPPTAHL